MFGKKCRRILAASLLFIAMTAGGCGNIAVHEELNQNTEDQVVIRIAWWGEEERHEVTSQVLKLYSELHPEVLFEELSSSWADYFEKLSLETAQGNMPDLVQMDYQYITTYTENGSLADLTPFVEDGIIRTEDMDEMILESGMVGGRLSGIAMGTSIISMIYNPEVFDEAGLYYPKGDWTWDDFAKDCMLIKERTGKYGAAMTPILDMNLYHYWVRQHGEELISKDQSELGYEDDSIYVEYVELFKDLIEADAVPNSDGWEAISARGEERLPIITGECGLMPEWNNFPVRMSHVNEKLEQVTPPLSNDSHSSGLWLKPCMFFSIAETSGVKKECAQFIDWFLHSKEANEILKGERGVPISKEIRDSLLQSEILSENQKEMFFYLEQAMSLCKETPLPEPAGIEGINEAFARTVNAYFYGVSGAEESAAEFRKSVSEILSAYEEKENRKD